MPTFDAGNTQQLCCSPFRILLVLYINHGRLLLSFLTPGRFSMVCISLIPNAGIEHQC